MKLDEVLKSLSISDGNSLTAELENILLMQVDTVKRPAGEPDHYYRFLFRLVQFIKPTLTLELGTSYGTSSACIADAHHEGSVITVDMVDLLREACYRRNVLYVRSDSLDKVKLGPKIDILFIDTEHDGERFIDEFRLYEPDLSENAIVLIDDIHLNQDMKDAWEIFEPEGWVKIELPCHGEAGFGAFIRAVSPLTKEE